MSGGFGETNVVNALFQIERHGIADHRKILVVNGESRLSGEAVRSQTRPQSEYQSKVRMHNRRLDGKSEGLPAPNGDLFVRTRGPRTPPLFRSRREHGLEM